MQCPVGGVTFIPIPRRLGPIFAGLLTIDLPPTVKKGQVYHIRVKQVTSALIRGRVFNQGDGRRRGRKGHVEQETAGAVISTREGGNLQWRRILGVFQLTIPVSTKHELLEGEERLLSVLRWIEKSISSSNRWFLVFQRYIEQIAGRVQDMGGDPDQVHADPNGDWKHHIHHEGEHKHHEHEARVSFSGKVSGLIYNRFGDFAGFLLDTEDGERHFETHERQVEELAERAARERILVTVTAERDDPDYALSMVLRETPFTR